MIVGSDARFCGQLTSSGAMVIIALHGELDLASRSEFEQLVQNALTHDPLIVAIDLRDLQFLDANGVAALLDSADRCVRASRRFFLVRGRPEVQTALKAAGVQDLFETVDRLDHVSDGDLAGLPA